MQPGGSQCTAVIYKADCRSMPELTDGAVDLAVTSPPYWQIKDYGSPGQIGFGQSLHEYLRDLQRVWAECFRVLHEGGRLCVNIGDQFARASVFGRYRVIPLHAEIICQCAETGFDFMGSIVWRKKTTMNTTGGAVVMGSYPYPPNGIVEIDFEYILIFKKPGTPRVPARDIKTRSALTREEWKSWFSGHWDVGGARKNGHEAPFPDEIPRRLIRMFSFPGGTVLDPFVGTGTTARVALAQGRNAVGYEIQADFLPARLAARQSARRPADPFGEALSIITPVRKPDKAASRGAAGRGQPARPVAPAGRPRVPDMVADPRAVAAARATAGPALHTVTAVRPDCSLELDSGTIVQFLGLEIQDTGAALDYLRDRVLKKKVFLRDRCAGPGTAVRAKIILKNRISINAQLVKSGAARAVPPSGR
jgi:DNA modification methylase